MADVYGAGLRRVEDREYLGKPALVVVAIRTYDATVEDLWDAITTPARLTRWLGAVTGDLRLGGRYEIPGNASGDITRCDPPTAIDVTWEFAGTVSWVTGRVERDGQGARLTIEHIAHKDGGPEGAAHFAQFGPAAGGIGWDLWLHFLRLHLAAPSAAHDAAAAEAWTQSSEGTDFVRGSGEAWEAADVAFGTPPDIARARAERTIAFYTGS